MLMEVFVNQKKMNVHEYTVKMTHGRRKGEGDGGKENEVILLII